MHILVFLASSLVLVGFVSGAKLEKRPSHQDKDRLHAHGALSSFGTEYGTYDSGEDYPAPDGIRGVCCILAIDESGGKSFGCR